MIVDDYGWSGLIVALTLVTTFWRSKRENMGIYKVTSEQTHEITESNEQWRCSYQLLEQVKCRSKGLLGGSFYGPKSKSGCTWVREQVTNSTRGAPQNAATPSVGDARAAHLLPRSCNRTIARLMP